MNRAQLTKPSRILTEQDSDPTLFIFKREMLGLPFDEQILLNDARYLHYSRNKKRIIIKDDILYRQYYNDIGEVSHLNVLLPGQLVKVILQTLHATAGKHPGISKLMQEIRQKYYFPSITTYVRNWVRDCEICIQDKRIKNTRIFPELIHIPEWDLGPEDLMQINLLTELPPGGGYENIITAIDVFSRYAFAYPISDPTAVNTAKGIIDIMTRHAYLPTLIITDRGSVFGSQSYTRGSRNIGHKFETCHNKTCTNHRGPRTGPRHNRDFFENGIRRIQETKAQIFTHCNPKLQHDIPLQYRLKTKPSIPRQISTQYPRPQTWPTI